jgi:tRNA threonylcarbamoyl adenosine modification protein YeaZ
VTGAPTRLPAATGPFLALVVDASSAAVTAGVVAVHADAVEVLAEQVIVDGRAHAELLAGNIRSALARAGIGGAQLHAVVAGVGPGPYTGLRVGIVTAAATADALGIAAYAVCSLDAIGLGIGGDALVATDARRKEVYWARYRDGARIDEPRVNRPAELGALLAAHPPAVMAGAGAVQYRDVLGLPLAEPAYPPVRQLAQLAADRIRGGAPADPLTPLYLRRPDAVEPTSIKAVLPS